MRFDRLNANGLNQYFLRKLFIPVLLLSTLSGVVCATETNVNRPRTGIKGEITAEARSVAPTVAIGDEWEYLSKDAFGKQEVLIGRVTAIDSREGVFEEFGVRGKPLAGFMFDGKPSVFVSTIDLMLLLSPYWLGDGIDGIAVLNPSVCSSYPYVTDCYVRKKAIVGVESITVPAGTFPTSRIELEVAFESGFGQGLFTITAWYSIDRQRLIRQAISGRHPIAEAWVNSIRGTIELTAFRSRVR